MRVIIAGGRELGDPTGFLISTAITASGFYLTSLVCGMAPGVDSLAYRWAKDHGIPILECPAAWELHGKAAGPMRNRAMAAIADALIAIPGRGKGTWNMIGAAKAKGLPVYVHTVT